MDRQIVYIGAIPQDTDLLLSNKNAMISDGWIAQSVLGTATLFYGLACTPTSPATLTVNVASGAVFAQQNIDNSAYGSLGSDTSHQIVKVGVNKGTLNFSTPAPVTSGQSVVYLIQAAFVESDGGSAVLPYYNAASPATPWAGPNNTGVSQNTVRQNLCSITIKTGTAATTGTQVTPAPDVGFTGLWAVTVANGQTTVTSGNIALVPGAPFITEGLTAKISQTVADARYAKIVDVQNDALDFALDTGGSANTIVAALNPAPLALTQGMSIVLTILHSNNGPSTLNLNGLGVKNITYQGNALAGGELVAGQNAAFSYNGTTWNLMSVSANQSHTYDGGTTTGSANAQVVTPVTPSGFSLIFGNIVTFTAGFTNTAAITINVQSTGVITIKKKSSGGGLVDLAASDITASQVYQIIYDGVFWELFSLSFPPSSTFFQVANNLSEGVAATMRSNLGLGTSALHATGDFLQTTNNLSDLPNKPLSQVNLGVRTVLTTATVYHVTPTGNDSTGDGSSGTPWLTVQHAADFVANKVDIAGQSLTVAVADGSYAGFIVTAPFVGGIPTFSGNTTTPTNCTLGASVSNNSILVQCPTMFNIQGFNLNPPSGAAALQSTFNAVVNMTGLMNFSGSSPTFHLFANAGGRILVSANYAISAGTAYHVAAQDGGVVVYAVPSAALTVTLSGTPAFAGAFASATNGGVIDCPHSFVTFSGAATGQQYIATMGGIIATSGATLPGSIAGSTATGGQFS